jgi:molybdopterin-guanine dinucleotide biosynthesis protein A
MQSVAPDNVSAAILAGGAARRFGGRDKCRIAIRGRPIIVRQVEVLQRVAGDVFIVGPDEARFADLGLPVHADLIAGAGAMGGLFTALEVAGHEDVLVVACDMPFLDDRLLLRLADLARTADAAWVRTTAGVEPLLACYRRGVRTRLKAAIAAGRLKLADLGAILEIREIGPDELVTFGRADELAANLNSPADLDKVE